MASGSAKAVYVAIGANSVITVAKLGAFFFTGSGSMLSEGIHSFADVLNQTLLAMGIAKAKKGADEDHPYGYGRDAFVWALISAVGIFFLGCGFTLYHGMHSLLHPELVEINDINVALGVLAFSFLLEGWTLMFAYREVKRSAALIGMSFSAYIQKGPDPMAVAVLLEDAAAVIGVTLAGSCIGMYVLTGDPIWDAVGSLVIALLLGVVAVFLVIKNRRALLGQAVTAEIRKDILDIFTHDDAVEGVYDVKATVMSTESFRFKAEIDFDGAKIAEHWLANQDRDKIFKDATASRAAFDLFLLTYGEAITTAVGEEIDRIEQKIRQAIPNAKHVDLEVD